MAATSAQRLSRRSGVTGDGPASWARSPIRRLRAVAGHRFATGCAIWRMFPNGSRTIARRSPYGVSSGSSSTCAPASTARWNVSSASSTYTYRKAGNGSRSAVDEIMMTESPMWISAGRPGSMSPVAANTSRRKWTCAATSSTTTRGVTDRYPARGSLPGTPQSPTAQWWPTRSTTCWYWSTFPNAATPPRRRRRPGSNIGRARADLSLTGAHALASRWVACAWKAWCE